MIGAEGRERPQPTEVFDRCSRIVDARCLTGNAHEKSDTADRVAAMSDLYSPPIGNFRKLGSIVAPVDEAASEDGHAFDWAAIRSLLADRVVQSWISGWR